MTSKRARQEDAKIKFDLFSARRGANKPSPYHVIDLAQPSASKLRLFNEFLQKQFGEGASFVPLNLPYKTDINEYQKGVYAEQAAKSFVSQALNRADKLFGDTGRTMRKELENNIRDGIMQFENDVYLYPKVQDYKLENTVQYLNQFDQSVAPSQNLNSPLGKDDYNEETGHQISYEPLSLERDSQPSLFETGELGASTPYYPFG